MWSNKAKINTSVIASGIVGSLVAPGAILCAEKFAPEQMSWLKKKFAHYFVEPHFGFYEKASSGIEKARQSYDARMREELTRLGKPEEAKKYAEKVKTREERVTEISDRCVTVLAATGADFLGTFAGQRLLNRCMGVAVKPYRTATFDAVMTLGAIAAMPTLLPKLSENISHAMSRLIRKITGISKERAEDISVPSTYVALPSFMGMLATVIFARLSNGRGKP